MRPISEDIIKQLLDRGFFDAQLIDLSYDHSNHTVTLKYGDSNNVGIFKDCFSANFNVWLEGMVTIGGSIEKPSDSSFFIHSIEIEDIKVNGVQLYKCSLTIPMMDCQVTCISIELDSPMVN
jgi:hypothetical protein